MENNNADHLKVKEWRNRLRFLADIIFATAMTFMILNIQIPEFGHITDAAVLTKFLANQLNNMLAFIIAFVVIAVYWMKHLEHFSDIKLVNQTFIWLQLLFLACIMLVPFWNTYVDRFPDNIAVKVLFSINMILVGLFSFLSYSYAASDKNRILHSNVSNSTIKKTKLQILTEPAIALLAAILVYINPSLWSATFLLVPILFTLRKKLVKIKYFKFLK